MPKKMKIPHIYIAIYGSTMGMLHLLKTSTITSNIIITYALLMGTVFCLAKLYSLWKQTNNSFTALKYGLLAGLTYHLTTLHWLGAATSETGSPTDFYAILNTLMTTALFFPWWGLAFWISKILSKRRTLRSWLWFPVLFSLAISLSGDLIMRIPLGYISLVALDTVFANILTILGSYGLTFFMTCIACTLTNAHQNQRNTIIDLTVCITLISGAALIGQQSDTTFQKETIASIQTNQTDNTESYLQRLYILVTQAISNGATTIILPEGSLLSYTPTTESHPSEYHDQIQKIIKTANEEVTIIAGSYTATTGKDIEDIILKNNAYIFKDQSVAHQYAKSHLVMFGEYVPNVFKPLGFKTIASPIDIKPGHGMKTFQVGTLPNFTIAICYEGILTGSLQRESRNKELIINISSEYIFGNTAARNLLLQYTRERAIELGKPIIRSTRNGNSAVILANGHVEKRALLDTEEILYTLTPMSAQATLFSKYGYLPLYIMWIICAVIAARQPRNIKSFTALP